MYTGQYEGALAQIREAEKTGNLPASGYKAQGTIFLKTGNLEDAFRSFEKALILSPDDPETLESMARICIAREKYSTALYYLDRATIEDPVRPNSYYLYGKIYETWKQDTIKAGDYYRRAAQYQDPKTKLIFNPGDLKK
jgi:Tfp pilus assembly protein PilF